jgi:hypothetical protein
LVFSITGGVPPYQYTWSNGQTGDRLTDVLPGLYTLSMTDRYGCRGEASVRISYTSSAQALAAQSETLVFPNPASGRFWLRTEEPPRSVRVFDWRGALLLHFEGGDVVSGMDVSGLASGLYRVVVHMEDGSVRQGPLAVAR